MRWKIGLMAVLLQLVAPARALVINDPAALNPAATVIDFEAFAVGDAAPSDGFAFITSTGATVQPTGYTQNPGVFEGQYYGFNVYSYFIDFALPVAEFGLGIFDPNFVGSQLRALDADGNLLETAVSGTDFPIEPPYSGNSTFVGFLRASNDIARIELLPAAGDFLGIDTVTYYRAPALVPVRGELPLLAAGLGLLLLTRRRARSGFRAGC